MATQLNGPVMPIKTVSCYSCKIPVAPNIHFQKYIRIDYKITGNKCDLVLAKISLMFIMERHTS